MPEIRTISQRLAELPHVVYTQISRSTQIKAKVSRYTYFRVLKGESQNLEVCLALAQELGCTVEEVLNPNFEFRDPRLEAVPG